MATESNTAVITEPTEYVFFTSEGNRFEFVASAEEVAHFVQQYGAHKVHSVDRAIELGLIEE